MKQLSSGQIRQQASIAIQRRLNRERDERAQVRVLVKLLEHGALSHSRMFVITGWEGDKFEQVLKRAVDGGQIEVREGGGGYVIYGVPEGVAA